MQNKYTLACLLISILIIGTVSIYRHAGSKIVHHYNYLHFGTTIQVTTGVGEAKLTNQTVQDINELLKALHYKWHPWREGDLQDLNKNLATLKPFATSQEIIEIILLSQNIYNKSQGYFNPAIGKLISYWGFHNDNPNTNTDSENNSQINFDNYIKHIPNPNQIIINKKQLRIQNTNPYLQLDVSGFIKADAMLKIKTILLAQHIHNAIINIGGDIYVMGYKDSSTLTPWVIAAKSEQDKLMPLKIYPGECIATSGVGARFIIDKKDNKFRHHIINPKTGKSATGFDSVTVIHHDPYVCDAAATALLVAGKNDYINIAQSMNIDKYVLVDHQKNVIISPYIRERLYLSKLK